MPSRNPDDADPDVALARLAGGNSGVVDHGELLSLGLTRHEIAGRLAKGRLHAIHRGVYAVGHANLTRRGRWTAALRAAGPGSLLCGFSGGALRGLSVDDHGVSHVCVPATGRRQQRALRVRTADLTSAERGSFRGLPVVSLPRLLLELAAEVGQRKLDILMAEAAHIGMGSEALDEQLRRSGGCRGVRALRAAADGYRGDEPTRSPPEAAFLLTCGRLGITAPLVNVPIGDREVDFFWPDIGLIVEIDGFGPHRHRERFEGDRERAVELRLAGYEYLPFTPRQVERRAEWVARCVVRAREQRRRTNRN